MQSNDEHIKEFQEVYEKKYGEKLTFKEACEAANNLLGLYDVLIDIDQRERRRKKRLETEPKGFHVEDGAYSCCVCGEDVSGDQTWYDKNGLKCIKCQNALNKKLIPASVCKNKESWYQMWELDHYFGVKHQTALKYVRQGKLKMRKVPSDDGRIHCHLFLIKDNIGALPSKPKTNFKKVNEKTFELKFEKTKLDL